MAFWEKTMSKKISVIAPFLFILFLSSLIAYQIESNGNFSSSNQLFDSLNVRFIGNWPFGHSYYVAYDSLRNLVFLSSGAGIYILDVSDPANPIRISEDIRSREAVYVKLFYDSSTQRLYFATGGWIEIWDVSDPYAPSRLCMFNPNGISSLVGHIDICVSGNYAYCVDSCFYIVDVSSPANPQVIGSCETGGLYMALKDSFAFVVTSQSGLRVIDISNPYYPEEVASAWTTRGGIFISGGYAYISAGLGLRIMDISDPYNCFLAGYYPSSSSIKGTNVIDTIAYCSTGGGLRLLSVANPENVYEISSHYCEPHGLFATKSYVYLADAEVGLKIVDVSNLSNPQLVGEYITPGNSREIFVSGSFAYVANEKGLYIIDAGDPQHPSEVGNCFLPYRPCDVFVSGSYAYVAITDSGLRVLDVSDPSNPYVMGSLNLPGWPWDYGLDISGHYCYIGYGWEDGLRVIDISDPAFPFQVGQCSLWCARDVDVSGLYAYVVSDFRFSAIDISDPLNPNEVGFHGWPPNPSDICVSGTYAFVVDSLNFYVFDIANPANPQLVFEILVFDCSGIEVSGQYAYIATITDRLLIFDVSDPINPIWTGYYESKPRYTCNKLNVQGAHAYVVSSLGLHIYQFYGAGVEEELEETIPTKTFVKVLQNPVSSNYIELLLASPLSDKAEITLYSRIGRKIRSYQLCGLKSGKNKLRLDAKGLPSGIYFLKLNGKPAGKVVKVR